MNVPWLPAAEPTVAAESTVDAEHTVTAEPPPFVGASLSEKAAEFRAKLANLPGKAAEFRAKLAILEGIGAARSTDTPSVAFTSGSDTKESLRTPQNGGLICVEIEPGVDNIVGANFNQLGLDQASPNHTEHLNNSLFRSVVVLASDNFGVNAGMTFILHRGRCLNGLTLARPGDFADAYYFELVWVGVAPPLQRLGLGRALMGHLQELVRAEEKKVGSQEVTVLLTTRSSVAASPFFIGCGFKDLADPGFGAIFAGKDVGGLTASCAEWEGDGAALRLIWVWNGTAGDAATADQEYGGGAEPTPPPARAGKVPEMGTTLFVLLVGCDYEVAQSTLVAGIAASDDTYFIVELIASGVSETIRSQYVFDTQQGAECGAAYYRALQADGATGPTSLAGTTMTRSSVLGYLEWLMGERATARDALRAHLHSQPLPTQDTVAYQLAVRAISHPGNERPIVLPLCQWFRFNAVREMVMEMRGGGPGTCPGSVEMHAAQDGSNIGNTHVAFASSTLFDVSTGKPIQIPARAFLGLTAMFIVHMENVLIKYTDPVADDTRRVDDALGYLENWARVLGVSFPYLQRLIGVDRGKLTAYGKVAAEKERAFCKAFIARYRSDCDQQRLDNAALTAASAAAQANRLDSSRTLAFICFRKSSDRQGKVIGDAVNRLSAREEYRLSLDCAEVAKVRLSGADTAKNMLGQEVILVKLAGYIEQSGGNALLGGGGVATPLAEYWSRMVQRSCTGGAAGEKSEPSLLDLIHAAVHAAVRRGDLADAVHLVFAFSDPHHWWGNAGNDVLVLLSLVPFSMLRASHKIDYEGGAGSGGPVGGSAVPGKHSKEDASASSSIPLSWSMYVGVKKHGAEGELRRPWQATYAGTSLGYFASEVAAAQAYDQAKRNRWGPDVGGCNFRLDGC
jgi:GNAT superfamily N-acetyltransferase